MVKSSKKVVAALMALVMMVSVTACSTDKSWAMKNDTLTAPIGTYIYYLYASYQSAESSVKDTTKPVLDQQIDGKSAESWIKDKALNYTKMLFVMNDKMKELNLTLTTDETKSISDNTDTQWTQSGTTLEKYGISKASFNLADADYYTKYQKIFTATYGKGGKKAVSDADLKTYFEKNYTDFSFLYAPLYSTDASGNSTALPADQTAAVKKEFDSYAADVTGGTKTMRQAADAYKTSSKATDDPLHVTTVALDSSSATSSYPAELIALLKSMKAGEVKAAEISGTYLLVMKNDVTKKTAEQLSSDSTRNDIIVEMKGTEYSADMEKEAQAYTNVKLNQSALDSYKPSMFVTPTVSTPAAASSTAASAAASTASSK
jgi:hypothetical protein